MNDRVKVVIGLAVFLVAAAFPIWWGLTGGGVAARPELQKAVGGESCVEPPEHMRDVHMDLLNEWRDDVVRNGKRLYVGADGREHFMSLSLSCLKCHADKSKFCDKCHDYAGVEPYCWDCHVDGTAAKGGE